MDQFKDLLNEIDGEDSRKGYKFNDRASKPEHYIDDISNTNSYIKDIPNKLKSRFKNMQD